MKDKEFDPNGWGNVIPCLILLGINLIAFFFWKLSGRLFLSWLILLLDFGGFALSISMLAKGELPPKIAVTCMFLCLAAGIFYIGIIAASFSG